MVFDVSFLIGLWVFTYHYFTTAVDFDQICYEGLDQYLQEQKYSRARRWVYCGGIAIIVA